MQFTTALLASAAAMTASALPQGNTANSDTEYFGLIAIQSGSAVQNAAFQAAQNSIMVGAKSQNASCDAETNSATFYIQDGELNLYRRSATPQIMYVDRSGFGQGIIGYTTGAQPIGTRSERKGWKLENDELKFDGTGLQVCPDGLDGSHSVWLQGVDKPGWHEGCFNVKAKAINTDKPIGCYYTEYQG